MQEGAGDGKTLTHAAGEFTREAVPDAGEADVFERFIRRCSRIRDAGQLAEEHQVLESREIVVNTDAVAKIADTALDVHLTFRGFRETRENAEQCGLPRPVAAEEGDTCARRNVEVRAAQRGVIAEMISRRRRSYDSRALVEAFVAGSPCSSGSPLR